MMVLERVGIGLENVMFNINPLFLQQIAIVTVYADKKLRVLVFDIFQALRHASGFMAPCVPGTRDKMKPVIRAEMLENIAPENNIVFIFHVNSCPTTQELCVHHKTFGCVIIIFFFRYGRRKHNN